MLETIFGFFRWIFTPIATTVIKNWNKLFGKNLKIVKSGHRLHSYWHIGSYGTEKKPCLQMVLKFTVTNLTNKRVLLTSATVNGHEQDELDCHLSVKEMHSRYSGPYFIEPHGCTSGSLVFFSKKIPVDLNGKPFLISVTLYDNFGKKYKLKNVLLVQS